MERGGEGQQWGFLGSPFGLQQRGRKVLAAATVRRGAEGSPVLQVMLVPRFHMDNALGGMADQFYLILKNDTRPMTLTNPEGYVKLVLDKLQVPYHPEKNPRLFPIADGRCEGGESFCVVQQYKDCRPMTHSWQINECQASYSNQAYHKTGGGSGGLGERMNAAIFRILKRMDRLDALNRMGLTVSV